MSKLAKDENPEMKYFPVGLPQSLKIHYKAYKIVVFS